MGLFLSDITNFEFWKGGMGESLLLVFLLLVLCIGIFLSFDIYLGGRGSLSSYGKQ